MKIMAKCLPPGFKKNPAILSFQFSVSETGRRPTSVDGNMTATLKIPPSTLVKSRQQNVGGSFYRIWRHDPCKLFKVIQLSPIIHQHLFVVVCSECRSWEGHQYLILLYLISVLTYFSRMYFFACMLTPHHRTGKCNKGLFFWSTLLGGSLDQCANILETFDHPSEAKIRSCDSLLQIGFEQRERGGGGVRNI